MVENDPETLNRSDGGMLMLLMCFMLKQTEASLVNDWAKC